MAWSPRGRDLPANWPAIRQRVLKRDGHRCTATMNDGTRCVETERLEVDHIYDNGNHADSNLRTLCHWHHARHTAAQSHAAAKARRAQISRRFRRTEQHPGLR